MAHGILELLENKRENTLLIFVEIYFLYLGDIGLCLLDTCEVNPRFKIVRIQGNCPRKRPGKRNERFIFLSWTFSGELLLYSIIPHPRFGYGTMSEFWRHLT